MCTIRAFFLIWHGGRGYLCKQHSCNICSSSHSLFVRTSRAREARDPKASLPLFRLKTVSKHLSKAPHSYRFPLKITEALRSCNFAAGTFGDSKNLWRCKSFDQWPSVEIFHRHGAFRASQTVPAAQPRQTSWPSLPALWTASRPDPTWSPQSLLE